MRTLHPQGLPPVLLLQPDGGLFQVNISNLWIVATTVIQLTVFQLFLNISQIIYFRSFQVLIRKQWSLHKSFFFCCFLSTAISQWDCWRSACLLLRSSLGTRALVRPFCNRTSKTLHWSKNHYLALTNSQFSHSNVISIKRIALFPCFKQSDSGLRRHRRSSHFS